MTDVLWVLVGIIIGGIGGILSISLVSAGRFEDKEKEIQDLRTQRELLKQDDNPTSFCKHSNFMCSFLALRVNSQRVPSSLIILNFYCKISSF